MAFGSPTVINGISDFVQVVIYVVIHVVFEHLIIRREIDSIPVVNDVSYLFKGPIERCLDAFIL